MSGGQTEKQAQLIRDFQPDMIMVTPSYCLNLIEELERQMGGDASGCSLRVGVFGAEPWTLAMREIERRLGISALDIYGLSEVMGPGWRWSVWKPPTARLSGKITSSRKWLTPTTVRRWRMANTASCCLPR
jgi:phenylacetate-CoA ligase